MKIDVTLALYTTISIDVEETVEYEKEWTPEGIENNVYYHYDKEELQDNIQDYIKRLEKQLETDIDYEVIDINEEN